MIVRFMVLFCLTCLNSLGQTTILESIVKNKAGRRFTIFQRIAEGEYVIIVHNNILELLTWSDANEYFTMEELLKRKQQKINWNKGAKIDLITIANAQDELYRELSKNTTKLLNQYLDLDLIKVCIFFGADPGTKGSTNWTVLHECAVQGDVNLARELLKNKVSAVVRNDKNNATPWMIATSHSQIKIANILIPYMRYPDDYVHKTTTKRHPPKTGLELARLGFQADLEKRIRLQSIQSRIYDSITPQKLGEIIKKAVSAQGSGIQPIVKSLIHDNKEEFNNITSERYSPLLHPNVFIEIGDINIEISILTLASVYGSVNILPSLFRTYNDRIGSFPKLEQIYRYTTVELAANQNTKQKLIELLNSNNSDAENQSIYLESSQNGFEDRDRYEVIIGFKNVKSINDISVYINNSKVSIDEYRPRKVDKIPDRDLHIHAIILADSGVNYLRADVKNSKGIITATTTFPFTHKKIKKTKLNNYYAIIIGEEEYRDFRITDLYNPIDDGRKLMKVLSENYGFIEENIYTLFNASKTKISSKVENICNTLGSDDNLLIFYAGHSKLFQNRWADDYYFIPVSATKNDRSTYISFDDFKRWFRGSNIKHILLIADACYAGGARDDEDETDENSMDDQVSRNIMTSGNLEEVPDKSCFLNYFIAKLNSNKKRVLLGSELHRSIRGKVFDECKKKPVYYRIPETGDVHGDFHFIRTTGTTNK